MKTANKWKVLPGTYNDKRLIKIVRYDRNSSDYILVGGEHKEELGWQIIKELNK